MYAMRLTPNGCKINCPPRMGEVVKDDYIIYLFASLVALSNLSIQKIHDSSWLGKRNEDSWLAKKIYGLSPYEQ